MTGRRDGTGSGMTKGASILSGPSLNIGALRASSQKEECQESVAVLGSPTQDWTEEVGEA